MLSFIPTPIGNKEDITLRALRLLKELNIFFCEDTRTTIKLMRMYDIDYRNKQLLSFTSHTDERKMCDYIELIRAHDCGVLSEAGTPGLSDPGKHLIKHCWESDLKFEILPGANALIPGVIAAPANTSKFVYLGFPPLKKGRKTFFTGIIQDTLQSVHPVFIYESVHRIVKALEQMKNLGFDGEVFLGKEISKMHEQYHVGSCDDLIEKIASGEIMLKGEFILGFYQKNNGK